MDDSSHGVAEREGEKRRYKGQGKEKEKHDRSIIPNKRERNKSNIAQMFN